MKYAKLGNKKTHASEVKSGTRANDLWYTNYEVVACVGKYRQYWKYADDKPVLPNGYEPETDWHAAWKKGLIDDACEVVCGDNREHRADIKTSRSVIEIQKSAIDGWAVVERTLFYKSLTGSRLIWVVNVEKPWSEKRIKTTLVAGQKGKQFKIDWKYAWKWVMEISNTKNTHLFLDFNSKGDKLIHMWTFKEGETFGRWILKTDFYEEHLKEVSRSDVSANNFLEMFRDINNMT